MLVCYIGADALKPAAEHLLPMWPESRRVNRTTGEKLLPKLRSPYPRVVLTFQ